jgi:hypothetical protein
MAVCSALERSFGPKYGLFIPLECRWKRWKLINSNGNLIEDLVSESFDLSQRLKTSHFQNQNEALKTRIFLFKIDYYIVTCEVSQLKALS